MSNLLQDLRYALRMFVKNPGFSAIAVLTLALGIGANAAIFSLLDAVLLDRLPIADPGGLILFGKARTWGFVGGQTGSYSVFSKPLYSYFREHSASFSELCASQSTVTTISIQLPGSTQSEPAPAKVVSGSYFSVLGVRPSLGRAISSEDDTAPGANPVVVVSHLFWQTRLGSDPAAVGRPLVVNGQPFAIIGVAPTQFYGETLESDPAQLWFPISMTPQVLQETSLLTAPDVGWLQVFGRLQPGVSLPHAAAEATLLIKQHLTDVAGANPAQETRERIDKAQVELAPAPGGISHIRARYSTPLYLLMGMVALILLIACINIANLLLARAAARQREISVRSALGASRGRLVRQLLTESLLLSLLGGALGLVIAQWTSTTLVALAFGPRGYFPADSALAPPVLLFSLGVCILTAVLFGLIPALRASKTDFAVALRISISGGGGLHRGRINLTNGLVVAQVALSLTLIVSAGLFVRSLIRLETQDLGFEHTHTLIVNLSPRMARYPVERLPAFYDALIERLRALPGVESASLSLNSPLNGNQWNGSFFVEAAARGEKGQEVYAWWTRVTSDYFRTLGMKLRYGRLLQPTDGANAIRVAVVNETFVRKYLANSNPLERRISRDEGRPSVQIVGVIADAKYQDANVEAPAMVFLSILQSEPGNTPESIRAQLISQYAQNLEVRATGDPARLSDSVRQVLHEIAPDVPITQIQTLDQQIDRSLSQQRLITYLAGGFGLLAVTMACIGLYGTMSYSVGRRTKEVGVRMALGAQPRDILREVTAQGAGLALAGIVIGIVAAVGAARLVASQLYGIAPTDLITFAGAVLLLAVVALIACLIPARRATRVDPMVALRYE